MKMKRIEMALAAFTLSFCSMADTHTWKSRAAGGWNDGESYEEGVAPEDGDFPRGASRWPRMATWL